MPEELGAGAGGSCGGASDGTAAPPFDPPEEAAELDEGVDGTGREWCWLVVVDRPGFACARRPASAPVSATAATVTHRVSVDARRKPVSRAVVAGIDSGPELGSIAPNIANDSYPVVTRS